MKIVAFVPDLMDRSRFGSVSSETVFVRTAAEVLTACAPDKPDVVVLDFGREGALELVAQLAGLRLIGFASHVERDGIAQAKAAGVAVYPRSRFFSHIVELIKIPDH